MAKRLQDQDDKVYRLDSFSVMPNHVHVVFSPLPLMAEIISPETSDHVDKPYHSLALIMQSLKGVTAREANQLLCRSGEFWAHESYDHYIRHPSEWHRIMRYVLNNPVKAGYVANWQDWKWNYRRP